MIDAGRSKLSNGWVKGKSREKIKCPHCENLSSSGNAKRWHFENCKYKN